ncbi:hypothetical protein KRR55_13200 [Paeniglutamicibacter sp. ABSL32-1]|uniref:hypothetical protein n=1 Tax=Paeniglutamicibacter quisquiliarum TaxID=2849498 RepID=UPI001C2D3CC4|nr:hypothetical protein [Paeniglutamicibacter quisquiliarum]MBV1780068.1 hypothetical protein [Paeniglutamicibacter quisquiliarum]
MSFPNFPLWKYQKMIENRHRILAQYSYPTSPAVPMAVRGVGVKEAGSGLADK